MNKENLLSLLIFLGINCCLFGQEKSRPYRQYQTQEVHQRLLLEDPDFSKRLQNMENYIQGFGTAPSGVGDTIPVIFHVLYSPGQWRPSEFQVLAQLDTLNKYFSQYSPPANPYIVQSVQELITVATAPEIYFCLADFSDENQPVTAIHYVETAVNQWQTDDAVKHTASGGTDVQLPSQALNIWIGYLPGETAGYAQMPTGPAGEDGIVLNARFVPGSPDSVIQSIYGTGKSLVHLVGAYLGLYELWNVTAPCSDDKVEDTPLHNTPNYFPGDIDYHISLCDSLNRAEMIMNFMDNTDDVALNMFTQGQKNRMKAVLAPDGPRGMLSSGGRYCSADPLIGAQNRDKKRQKILTGMVAGPNPAESYINVALSSTAVQTVHCTITTTIGDLMWEKSLPANSLSNSLTIDCASWSNGVYLVSAVFENGATHTQKILITSH